MGDGEEHAMRNASWDSATDVYVILVIAVVIVVGIGLAMCKMMGWERKAFANYVVTILGIGASFLLVAHLLTRFF